MLMRRGFILCAGLAASLVASDANAFAILTGVVFNGGSVNVEASLSRAPRWSAGPDPSHSLYGGIDVRIDPGFIPGFGRDAAESQVLLDATFAAFDAWEAAKPALDFNVSVGTGGEINLFSTTSADPLAQGNLFSGLAIPLFHNRSNLYLTDGTIISGREITGGTIYFVTDRYNGVVDSLISLGLIGPNDLGANMQQLMMHEIGHLLGFGHPNDPFATNWDTDGDSTTVIPANLGPPWLELIPNTQVPDAVMNGLQRVTTNRNFLTADDLSGLNVLYPTPEPSVAVLWMVMAGALWRRFSTS